MDTCVCRVGTPRPVPGPVTPGAPSQNPEADGRPTGLRVRRRSGPVSPVSVGQADLPEILGGRLLRRRLPSLLSSSVDRSGGMGLDRLLVSPREPWSSGEPVECRVRNRTVDPGTEGRHP